MESCEVPMLHKTHPVELTAGCILPISQFAHTKRVVAAEVYLPAAQSEHAAVLETPLYFP